MTDYPGVEKYFSSCQEERKRRDRELQQMRDHWERMLRQLSKPSSPNPAETQGEGGE